MNSKTKTGMKGREDDGDDSPALDSPRMEVEFICSTNRNDGDNDRHMDEGDITRQLRGGPDHPCTGSLLEIPQQTGGNQLSSDEASGVHGKQVTSTTDEAYHPGDENAGSSPADHSLSREGQEYWHNGGIGEWLYGVWEGFIAAWGEGRQDAALQEPDLYLGTEYESDGSKECIFKSIPSRNIQIAEILAIGSFGIVRHCQVKVKRGLWVSGVIKRLICPKLTDIVNFEREAVVLQTLSGVNGVPELYGRHGKQGPKNIVMSHNGSLTLYGLLIASQRGVASLALLVRILKKVARILHDIHERGFGHNDLHANNIVLDDAMNPTIVDFGYALPFGKVMRLKLVPLASAVWSQYDPLLSVCGQSTCPENDVYSFGHLVYEVLLQDQWYPLEQWRRMEDLVVKALSPRKESRPSLLEFCDCLHELESICLTLFTGVSE